jgi:hypothetical protein
MGIVVGIVISLSDILRASMKQERGMEGIFPKE